MAFRLSLCLLLAVCPFSNARPGGPPIPEVCVDMTPRHNGSVGLSPPAAPLPVEVQLSPPNLTYGVGDTIIFNLNGIDSETFKGFMVQARTTENRNIGTFRLSTDSASANVQILTCNYTGDTAGHNNTDRNNLSTISVQWTAPASRDELESFAFYYTVVQNFATFWVMQVSETLQVEAATPECKQRESSAGSSDLELVRAHGVVMTVAWGLLAPVGILLALFYKVVWPNGQWFYAHIVLMSTTIGLTLFGILLIVIHAEGKWLTSTDVNLPHQVLGIVATATVSLNPLLALARCEPESKWRWIYNWTHGSIGLILGQSVAFGAMLLGLYVFRELVSDCEDAHTAIYTTATLVGVVGTTVVFCNLYTTSYHKVHKKPGQKIGDEYYERDDAEVLEPSMDYWFRIVVGVVIIVVLATFTVVTVAYIVLANES